MKSHQKRFRLQRRVAAWNRTMNDTKSDYKVQQRKETGGYKCPGSYRR